MAARSLLFLVPDVREVSVRFRVLQYVPHLERLGWSVTVRELRGSLAEGLRALRAAAGYDRVVAHRLLLTPIEATLLRASAGGYVYDFDDAIMVRDSSRARQRSWQRERRLARTLGGASVVLAGNDYLAAWARRHHRRVFVLPTVIDLAGYTAPENHGSAGIGWIGTHGNLRYLRSILPAIASVCRDRPRVRLDVVCDAPLEDAGCPIENTRWSLAEEARALAGFAVGIAPLADDPWTRGKCGAKILQYFAAGLPVVCSPVAENPRLVQEGESGFLASNDEEWVSRLAELLDDAALRRRFGTAGRRFVEQHRSVDVGLGRLLEALQ